MTNLTNLSKLIKFEEDISDISIPNKFTYPFYYTPHPLAIMAMENLQRYLKSQKEWDHNFGLNEDYDPKAIGKMFGVLVVKTPNDEIAYIAGFSGKLANRNHHEYFVPPVYDVLNENDFYLPIEANLNSINKKLEEIENNRVYKKLLTELNDQVKAADEVISKLKSKNKILKKKRKEIRVAQKEILNEEDYIVLLESLSKESIYNHYLLKDTTNKWTIKLKKTQDKIDQFQSKIENLKTERQRISASTQERIFKKYSFLNANKNRKNLLDIFKNTYFQKPPSGAGECAAPKLLQYAYINNLQPIALAEFWWGQSPRSEIRKHKNLYPACKGKCEPILSHMLQGLEVDDNPLLLNPANDRNMEIVYEDEAIVIINKPHEFLSVPGKHIQDSVLSRLHKLFPECTGPLLLHRLDMSTSGILLMAKSEKIHAFLQRQFLKRTIKKRYLAVLDGVINKEEGIISLPIRGDFYDRPRQLVCTDHGKESKTKWKVISIENNRTRIHLYPITGRTHQLRVHAAHPDGLNASIVGDDLYGRSDERLMLHAEYIQFIHPTSRKLVEFTVKAEF